MQKSENRKKKNYQDFCAQTMILTQTETHLTLSRDNIRNLDTCVELNMDLF